MQVFTNDLKRRLSEHKSGKVKFTSQRLPVKLIHYEAYTLKTDAMRREYYLKTTEGKRFLRQQIRDSDLTPFLAKGKIKSPNRIPHFIKKAISPLYLFIMNNYKREYCNEL